MTVVAGSDKSAVVSVSHDSACDLPWLMSNVLPWPQASDTCFIVLNDLKTFAPLLCRLPTECTRTSFMWTFLTQNTCFHQNSPLVCGWPKLIFLCPRIIKFCQNTRMLKCLFIPSWYLTRSTKYFDHISLNSGTQQYQKQ